MKTDTPSMAGELPFKAWHEIATALRSRRMDADRIMALVAEHPGALVHVQHSEEGGLGNNILLWAGEVRALASYLRSPSPVLQSIPKANAETSPVSLREVMADLRLFEVLLERLKSLLLYDPSTLPDFPEWIWNFSGAAHDNLLIENGRLVPPPDWESKDGKFDKLEADHGCARIIDGEGRMGLITETGEVTIPCSFAYLSRPRYGDHLACEASADAMPEQWDACDLVDSSGRRLNPPDIKIKAGTLWSDIAIVHPGSNSDGLTGFMTSKGELLGNRRWKDVRKFSEYLAAVQDPETGLWGYIDDQGVVAISPGFTTAHRFDRGYADVATPDSDGLFGLLDRTGEIVVKPAWSKIDWFLGKYYTVTDTEDAFGLIDNRGNVVIEPVYPSREEDAEIDAAKDYIRKHPFVRMLGEQLKEKVAAIGCDSSLASLTGVFSPSWAKDIELLAAGLWGRRVEVIADYKTEHMSTPIDAGSTGSISWYYPVTGDIFDLSAEAPVRRLPILPHASIGMPWGHLRFTEENL